MLEKSKNIKVAEAAKIMGKDLMFVRKGLQRNVLPFGYAIETKPDRWSYHISRKKFEEYMGNLD